MATVTTPVLLSIANRPPAESSSENVIALLVASASEALTVIPTSVPFAVFSAMLLAVVFESLNAPTANSLMSVTFTVITSS